MGWTDVEEIIRSSGGNQERQELDRGQELVVDAESGGRLFPVEAKMGLPDPRDLPKLERIRGDTWQDGTVLSLAVGEAGAALREDWRAGPPEKLDFLPLS